MNWITDVLTSNQWTVVWLAVGLVLFVLLYIWHVTWHDPLGTDAGRWNPLPMLWIAGFGTMLFAGLFMGVGFIIDGLIWMWNN